MSSSPLQRDQNANQIRSPPDGDHLGLEEDSQSDSHVRESACPPPALDHDCPDLSSRDTSPESHNDSLERLPTAQDVARRDIQVQRTTTSASWAGPVHSVFTPNQKRFIVFMAAWAGFFSPVSGNIYLPALNPLARDLNVSNTLINLTLTSYMVR